jgi:hypothetical protein
MANADAPNTNALFEKWMAVDAPKDLQSNERFLTVSGPVEVAPGETAHLKEHVPQGINPSILLLDAVVEGTPGPELILIFQHVHFRKRLERRGQYKEVSILRSGNPLTTIKVVVAESFA